MDANRDSFLQYLQFEKRLSSHTILAYSGDLDQFFKYLSGTYIIKDLSEINHTLIRSWAVDLMANKISPPPLNPKTPPFKTFYKYLLRQNIVTENPMLKIMSPKTSKRLPVFVEKDNMNDLIDNVEFGDDVDGIRNKLIIELFYATGIRLSELINLKIDNVDLHACQIKVLGKRNKERIVPFNDQLRNSIQNYIDKKPSLPSEFLFQLKSGKKMYEKFVYRLVNKYLSIITTIDKTSPHVLRHTFATHMLNNGADLNAIKELLGHANLAATQVYTHNTVEKLKNIHKQAHPKG